MLDEVFDAEFGCMQAGFSIMRDDRGPDSTQSNGTHTRHLSGDALGQLSTCRPMNAAIPGTVKETTPWSGA